MTKPSRIFLGDEGDYSTGLDGPEALKDDLDQVYKMFDPASTHEDASSGGIGSDNIQNDAITDNAIGDRTVNQSIATAYSNTGKLTVLLSFFAKVLKSITGKTNWYDAPTKSLEQLNTNKLETSEVVTTATANKILKLDSNSKLPTSVTGVADGSDAKLDTHKDVTILDHPNGSVTTAKIKDVNVTESKLATDSVTETKIKNSSVTNSKIADNSISTSKIINDAVTTAKIISNAITTIKISDLAITTAKLANESVTYEKLDPQIPANSVETSVLNTRVTTIENQNLDSRTTTLETELNTVQETTVGPTTDNVISVPDNVDVKGQVSVTQYARTVSNLLGSDGDCESTSPFLTGYGTPTLSLDSVNKVYGNNSLKLQTSSIGHGTGLSFKVQANKYYFLSMTHKTITGANQNSIYDQVNAVNLGVSDNITSSNFARYGRKFATTQNSNDVRWLWKQADSTNLDTNIDGVMVNEITQDEYNNLTVNELMGKYNFVNNTKSTVLAIRKKAITKNRFDKNSSNILNDKHITSGGIVAYAGRSVSDYIKVKSGETIKLINTSIAYRTEIYDLNKNKINFSEFSLTIPITQDGYIRTTIDNETIDTAMVILNGQDETYEAYDESISYTYATDENGNAIELHEVGTAKDEVKDGKVYKRTGKKAFDGTTLSLALSSASSSFTNIDVYYYAFTRGSNSGHCFNSNGYYENKGTNVYNFVDDSSILQWAMNNDYFYIAVPKGNTPTYPTSLIYQLAQSYEIPLNISPLIAYPNGTVYFDFAIKKAYTYDSGITFKKPMSSIEEVIKVDGDIETYIDLSYVTLASDGLSITISGAVDGESYKVESLIRSEESTSGEKTLTFSANRGAQIDNNTEMNKQNAENLSEHKLIAVVGAGEKIESGKHQVNSDFVSFKTVTVAFNKAYANIPVVIANFDDSIWNVSIDSVTTTSFTFTLRHIRDSATSTIAGYLNYFVVGK